MPTSGLGILQVAWSAAVHSCTKIQMCIDIQSMQTYAKNIEKYTKLFKWTGMADRSREITVDFSQIAKTLVEHKYNA